MGIQGRHRMVLGAGLCLGPGLGGLAAWAGFNRLGAPLSGLCPSDGELPRRRGPLDFCGACPFPLPSDPSPLASAAYSRPLPPLALGEELAARRSCICGAAAGLGRALWGEGARGRDRSRAATRSLEGGLGGGPSAGGGLPSFGQGSGEAGGEAAHLRAGYEAHGGIRTLSGFAEVHGAEGSGRPARSAALDADREPAEHLAALGFERQPAECAAALDADREPTECAAALGSTPEPTKHAASLESELESAEHLTALELEPEPAKHGAALELDCSELLASFHEPLQGKLVGFAGLEQQGLGDSLFLDPLRAGQPGWPGRAGTGPRIFS